MSLIVCKTCGILLFGNDKAIGYCNNCHALHKKEYTLLKEYLHTHPNASIMDVVSETGLSLRSINKMIEEDKLEIRSNTAKKQWSIS